jgi:Zn-finger nucleic acid-binding protein
METVLYENVEIDRCTTCQGIWFDRNEQEQLRKKAGSETIDTGSQERGEQFDTVQDIVCPRDGAMMRHIVVANQRHIGYEKCPRCGGVFFDAGEFRDFKTVTLGELIKSLFR